MKMTLAGLLKTPEVCLARARLRRLSDPSDTLATAEIRALGSCEEPEVWLTDRLRSLAAEDEDHRWSEADHVRAQRAQEAGSSHGAQEISTSAPVRPGSLHRIHRRVPGGRARKGSREGGEARRRRGSR